MTMPSRPHLHHIAVTVTDLAASTRWYQDVFGLATKMDIPHQGGVGRILTDEAATLIIVLHEHDTNDGNLFRRQWPVWITSACGCPCAPTSRPGRTTSSPKASSGVPSPTSPLPSPLSPTRPMPPCWCSGTLTTSSSSSPARRRRQVVEAPTSQNHIDRRRSHGRAVPGKP